MELRLILMNRIMGLYFAGWTSTHEPIWAVTESGALKIYGRGRANLTIELLEMNAHRNHRHINMRIIEADLIGWELEGT